MRNALSVLATTAALALSALPATAALTQYSTTLTGPAENPPNPSTATGSVLVTIDDVLKTMNVHAEFTGLLGGAASAAHIHCCTDAPANVGVAVGMPSFPALTGAIYDRAFDMTDASVYSSGFRTTFGGGTALGSFDALVANMNSGRAYFNIHNAIYPGGEIRGFLAPVPEPETYALMLAGLGIVGWAVRGRKRA